LSIVGPNVINPSASIIFMALKDTTF